MNTVRPPAASIEPPISPENRDFGRPHSGWRRRRSNIIFESNTPAARSPA
jgi:hypothetical protein